MNNPRYSFLQITRLVMAVLSFAAIITMLTSSLLNAARAGAEAEKANSSFEIPK
jgi:hypothetical protein